MSGLTRRVARLGGARKPRARHSKNGLKVIRRGPRVYRYAMALADQFAANSRYRKTRSAKRRLRDRMARLIAGPVQNGPAWDQALGRMKRRLGPSCEVLS